MVKVFGPPAEGRRRRWRFAAAAAALLAAAGCVAFLAAISGSVRLRSALMERSGADDVGGVVRAVATAPLHRILAAAALADGDRMALNVKFKHIHKIHEQRDESRRTGILSTSDADLVPGEIEVGAHTARIRLRLAGDRVDLLKGERWPLYVRTRGDDHVFGMRSFELRPPSADGFLFPHLLMDYLAREDIAAPRYGIVDFTLNGKPLGVMAIEEIPSAELLARRERREGPVLRFDSFPRFGEAAGVTAIAPVRSERIAESKTLSRNASTAARLLQAYLHGSLAASDVFDAESFGRYLAIVEIWGADYALHWRNLRFYFNPLTAHLEPVGFVGDRLGSGPSAAGSGDSTEFAKRLLSDPRIASAYREARRRVDSDLRSDDRAEEFRTLDAGWLHLLHREFPLRLAFDPATALESRENRLETSAVANEPQAIGAATTVRPGAAAEEPPLRAPSIAETLAAHSFLSFDDEQRELRAAAGRWEVEGSLLLPEDVGLYLPAGTVLRFTARHGIIARGPLRFEGREDAPVVLEGPTARRRSKLWSGIYVIESSRPSRWSHVVVRNTGGFKGPDFTLAGGVVFRKAPVVFENCTFRGDRTDDALNVVRTTFDLRDVEIVDAELDGFDADYGAGSIVGGSIARVGGDCIDLGGTRATIRGIHLSDARDKAISVGEGSVLEATAVQIDHVGIGVASKNGATAAISDSDLRDVSDVALVAYMNRPEFGPGSLVAANNRITRTALPALAQIGSRLELDGRTIRPVDAAINRLYKDGNGDAQ